MSQELFINSFSVPNAAAGTAFVLIAGSGAAAGGAGGVTITNVYATNGHVAGTIPYTLLKYDNSGTPTLNGTVATTGGTIVADVPLSFTIGPNNYVNDGESVKLAWTGGGTPAADAALVIHYKMGRANV